MNSKPKEEIQITIIDRDGEEHVYDVPMGIDMSMMELLKSCELPIKGTCGGMALCSTCHCYVESDHALGERSDAEEDMLDQAFFVEDNSRLTCQIPLNEELDGLVLRLAPEAAE